MKHFTLLAAVGCLLPTVAECAELTEKPLKELPLNLHMLERSQIHTYKWAAVTEKGDKREAKDYAVLVVSTKLEGTNVLLHDTITLAPSYDGTVFTRSLKYPKNNLLHPVRITLDIAGEGKSVREMTYENGEMPILDSPSQTRTEHWGFEDGILTFNALLRLAPLLPREAGGAYTFRLYGEPFLFRIHEAAQKEPACTLTSLGPETVKIGRKSHECVRFKLDLKSVKITTEIWVSKSDLVIKLVDALPEGADATFLEATLQE